MLQTLHIQMSLSATGYSVPLSNRQDTQVKLASANEDDDGSRLQRFLECPPGCLFEGLSPECSGYKSRNQCLLFTKAMRMIKKLSYGQRVRDIEHAVFTLLVLSTSGGMEGK